MGQDTQTEQASMQLVNYKVGTIDENVKELRKLSEDMKVKWFESMNSMSSLRHDLNTSMSLGNENKVLVGQLDKRIENLESFENIVKYTGRQVKWLLGFVGFQSVAMVIYIIGETLGSKL